MIVACDDYFSSAVNSAKSIQDDFWWSSTWTLFLLGSNL